jgi:hypothetical protein
MRFLILLACISTSFFVNAQSKFPVVDKSPLDVAYFPTNYPVLKMQNKTTEQPIARVIYSRPQKNGRNIFGELVEYGRIWRCGANEATEIEFFTNVKLGGTKIKKGRYSVFCVPYSDKWTIIINKDLDNWGSFTYDIKKDVARLNVPVVQSTESLDAFTMIFEKTTTGFELDIAWDTIRLNVPFTF